MFVQNSSTSLAPIEAPYKGLERALESHKKGMEGHTTLSHMEQMKKRDNDLQLKFIPEIPREFCFAYERFSSSTFCADEFVIQNSKKVQSLEVLREQLSAYLKLLKKSMIELIHEDYTEFINLSANLISFEKSIANLLTPLSDFQHETNSVQTLVNERIQQIQQKRHRLQAIRNAKVQVHLVKDIFRHFDRVKVNVSELETKLESIDQFQNSFISFASQICFLLSETEVLIRKFRSSFAQLSSSTMDLCSQPKSYLSESKILFESLSERFFEVLNQFLRLLIRKDNFYDSIPLTESIVRILLLHDRSDILNKQVFETVCGDLDEIISESYVSKHGTERMLEDALKSIESDCEILLKAMARFDSATRFEIVSKSIWNEFVGRSIVRTPSLFSLAQAEQFYTNYQATCRFCARFLAIFHLEEHRKQFEKLNTYGQLMGKFNLNVYFHMQLQVLVPSIEQSLQEKNFAIRNSYLHSPSSDSNRENGIDNNACKLSLFATQLFYDKIVSIWSDQERSSDLFPYLWKITVKIISRFKTWIVTSVNVDTIVEQCRDLPREQVVERIAVILSDTQTFLGHFRQFADQKIIPLWNEYFEQNTANSRNVVANLSSNSMALSINDTVQDFHYVTSQCLLQLIRQELLSSAQSNLSLVNDIPRLFRRTNKDKPTKASIYVQSFVAGLGKVFLLMGGAVQGNSWQKDWFTGVLSEVFTLYKAVAMELLTSVQKTEDSLKKLKKANNARAQLPMNSAMSDDDKIRLQIYLDVHEMGGQVRDNLGVDLERSVPSYAELAATVSSLKNLM